MFWATKGPRLDTASYSKRAQARDTNTWIQHRPPEAVTLDNSHKLAPRLQRSELFTKQHFLIPHSPAPMADQWHLVQYFIKSSWKLTVQSMRKLQSLSHINYLQGCLGAAVRPICHRDIYGCTLSTHSKCRKHILASKPPYDSKHRNFKERKFFARKVDWGLQCTIFVLCVNYPGI